MADARQDLVEAVALCRRDEVRAELVMALKALGQVERDLARGDAARVLYEEAVGIARELDDPLILAHTVRHLGDVHQDAGRSELAEPCYREALDIYRRHPGTTPLDLANAIRPMAILKGNAGDIGAARQLWEEASALYTAVGVVEGVAESATNLKRLRR